MEHMITHMGNSYTRRGRSRYHPGS
jgi:hypothetical protein